MLNANTNNFVKTRVVYSSLQIINIFDVHIKLVMKRWIKNILYIPPDTIPTETLSRTTNIFIFSRTGIGLLQDYQ